jgi:DNA ligase-1
MVSDEEQFRRLASLGGITIIAQQLPNFVKVPSYIGNDIESYLDNFIADGFEGIIIRHQRGLYEPLRSTYMMKLKVRKIARFIITGFEEAFSIHGEAKNELGAFWLKTETNEEFKVGSGFTQQQRDDFWQADPKDLLNHNCEIYYQELSERGVPIFPIFRHLC